VVTHELWWVQGGAGQVYKGSLAGTQIAAKGESRHGGAAAEGGEKIVIRQPSSVRLSSSALLHEILIRPPTIENHHGR
jgi:hypothetical protein